MRRHIQALACLVGLAALSWPAEAAAPALTTAPVAETTTIFKKQAAAKQTRQACRVVAAKPVIAKSTIRGTAARAGCDSRTRLRVRIMKVLPGPDRTVKSGSKLITNGKIVAGLRCISTPARYYVVAIDVNGSTTTKSRAVSLSCKRPTPPKTGGSPTGTETNPNTNPSTSTGASSVEEAVVRLTNQARAANGCRALVHDPKLHAAAERHSADMAARGYFDHTSPDGRDPGDRVQASGFSPIRTWGENIAMGQRTAEQVVQGWLDSPGHRANIMNCSFTHIGVGHATKGPHWTQVFAAH